MKYSEKNEFIKESWGGPHLNFEKGPGVPVLNFEGGPQIPLLNFERGPGSQGPGVLVPLLHHAILALPHVRDAGIFSQVIVFVFSQEIFLT